MLKRIITSAICLSSLLYTTAASARQWVVLTENPRLSVDVDSIKGEGATRTFWSEMEYHRQDSSEYNISFRSNRATKVKKLTYVDCNRNKTGTLRAIEYNSSGEVIDDYDLSHLSVPPVLSSTVPDTLGEIELLYVCGLRTANGGRRNTVGNSRQPRANQSVARTTSFPQRSCGDPYKSNGTYWPVFIDGGNLNRIRSNFCNDAFAITRSQGIRSVQLASFTSYERASSFARQVGGTVGEATRYVNGRIVN